MLKKIIILSLLFCANMGFAKRVKFAVDMTGQTISPNGVHVSGDFQDEAGYGSDWNSDTTELTKEPGTDIYSIVVNIPAFRKYEYKYVNGDKFYEVEFVPEKSRVGYDFNDSRWIYIDSLSDDVTLMPVLLFGGNAPAGKKMVKFKVDMQSQFAINSDGVHVIGNFQNWNKNESFMYSFGNKVHEYVAYVDSANCEYKFTNGVSEETLTGSCKNSKGNRQITITSDTIINEVCFESCSDCIEASINKMASINMVSIAPNPSNTVSIVNINSSNGTFTISVKDITGRTLMNYENVTDSVTVQTTSLNSGFYLLNISNGTNFNTTLKLQVNH